MKLTEFAKGIKADCNHLVKNIHPCTFLTASFLQSKKLVSVWNHRHPCRIAHTVRNIEHCTLTFASELLILKQKKRIPAEAEIRLSSTVSS